MTIHDWTAAFKPYITKCYAKRWIHWCKTISGLLQTCPLDLQISPSVWKLLYYSFKNINCFLMQPACPEPQLSQESQTSPLRQLCISSSEFEQSHALQDALCEPTDISFPNECRFSRHAPHGGGQRMERERKWQQTRKSLTKNREQKSSNVSYLGSKRLEKSRCADE